MASGPADTRCPPQTERRRTDERLGPSTKEERRSQEDRTGRVKHTPSLFRSNCSNRQQLLPDSDAIGVPASVCACAPAPPAPPPGTTAATPGRGQRLGPPCY